MKNQEVGIKAIQYGTREKSKKKTEETQRGYGGIIVFLAVL